MPRLLLPSALAMAAAAVVLPDAVRLDHRFPVVDVVAWRPHSAAVTTAAAALLVSRRRTRPAGLALGAVGLAGLAAVAGRLRVPPAPAAATDLTVLTANVLTGRADTGALATLLERERPDFVVLPEAGQDFRDKLMPLVEALGYRSWCSTERGVPDVRGVTLLASARAGELTVRPGPEMHNRHLEVSGGVLGARRLFAVHPSAPLGPVRTARWRSDLRHVARWCAASPAPIVAGDFNATPDHSLFRAALGGCRSAADGTGRGLTGTYPSTRPRWAGIQIDHVLVPRGAVTTRFEVLDTPGSDHRAVLVGMRLPATG